MNGMDRRRFTLALAGGLAGLPSHARALPAPAAPEAGGGGASPALAGSLTDVAGLRVGHFTDRRRPTGCTVVLAEKGAVCGVDVRGGAPGTRETDLLGPREHRPGGARDRAVRRLRVRPRRGHGRRALPRGEGRRLPGRRREGADRPGRDPVRPRVGDWKIRPDAAAGYEAARVATAGRWREGSIGAGAGATVGKLFGPAGAMKGGLGTASVRLPGRRVVAALVAVNALRRRRRPGHGRVLAGARTADGKDLRGAPRTRCSPARRPGGRSPARTRRIGVVATNVALTKAEATKVAQMAHDGLARAIRPVHTPWDGDTLFALSTGAVTTDQATRCVVGVAGRRGGGARGRACGHDRHRAAGPSVRLRARRALTPGVDARCGRVPRDRSSAVRKCLWKSCGKRPPACARCRKRPVGSPRCEIRPRVDILWNARADRGKWPIPEGHEGAAGRLSRRRPPARAVAAWMAAFLVGAGRRAAALAGVCGVVAGLAAASRCSHGCGGTRGSVRRGLGPAAGAGPKRSPSPRSRPSRCASSAGSRSSATGERADARCPTTTATCRCTGPTSRTSPAGARLLAREPDLHRRAAALPARRRPADARSSCSSARACRWLLARAGPRRRGAHGAGPAALGRGARGRRASCSRAVSRASSVLWTGHARTTTSRAVEWKNLFLALFVPQRGFLLALPAGLLLLWSWRRRLLRGEPGLAGLGRGRCCGARCRSSTCTRSCSCRCCSRPGRVGGGRVARRRCAGGSRWRSRRPRGRPGR